MVAHASRAERASTAHRAYAIVGLVFIGLMIRLIDLQVFKHSEYNQLARENQFRVKRVIAPRGVIRDRTGKSLVDNVAEYRLYVTASSMKSDTLLARLQVGFAVDTTAARARWHQQQTRGRGHLPVKVLGNLSKRQISEFEENSELYPEAFLEARGRRRYIYGDFATHVLGYVGETSPEQVEKSTGPRAYQLGDVWGRTGIEALEETRLRGLDGRRFFTVNAAGQELFEVENKAVPPIAGDDVYLTLDYDLQDAIENRFWPKDRAGAIVIMDIHTGGLLAAVSKPGYDLNNFSVGISTKDYNALRQDPLAPLFNRYAMAAYPPGSIYKIVSSTALVDHGVSAVQDVMDYCPGYFKVGRHVFRCHKEGGHGRLAMLGGFQQSCDVYYYQQAKALGVDQLGVTARRLGLGGRTGFALAESPGLIPSTDYYNKHLGVRGWTWAVAVNCIIGQGEVLVTPLQMARLVAAVANGGTLLQPQIIKRVVNQQGRTVYEPRTQAQHRDIFTPAMNRFLKNAMLQVVVGLRGTAKSALPDSILVAGKTGTAETPGKVEDHAWFVFFAPYENPQIAGVIIVERAGHGGAVAAPISRKIVTQYFGLRDRGMSYWRRLPELRRRGLVPEDPS